MSSGSIKLLLLRRLLLLFSVLKLASTLSEVGRVFGMFFCERGLKLVSVRR